MCGSWLTMRSTGTRPVGAGEGAGAVWLVDHRPGDIPLRQSQWWRKFPSVLRINQCFPGP